MFTNLANYGAPPCGFLVGKPTDGDSPSDMAIMWVKQEETINNHNNIWLAVWNMNFMTVHSVGNVIIPTDELHHFSEG